MAVSPGVQMREKDFLLTPTECACVLLAITVILSLWEWKRKKVFAWFDALLMLLMGLAGCVLTVMIFSQHPATSLNLQLLLLNPVHLFFMPSVLRRSKTTRYWMFLITTTCLFLAGGIFQEYAEGMYVLALCLLIRFVSNFINKRY